jgi:hypothetical protein
MKELPSSGWGRAQNFTQIAEYRRDATPGSELKTFRGVLILKML